MVPFALAVALTVAGCTSTGAHGGAPVPRAATSTPWVVPDSELASQRLIRVRLVSEEGSGRFRLLLRLHDPKRYQIRATHPLFNTRLWALDVDGDQALLIDFQQHAFCRYQGAAEIGAIPLGPFPFDGLPALLLGYLPLPPAGTPERATEAALAFNDALGRRWNAVLAHGVVERFEVESEETVTWRRDASGWYVLAASENGLDLRWKETLREPLTETMTPIVVPDGWSEGSCDLGWLRAVEDAPLDEE